MSMKNIANPAVKQVFEAYPEAVRKKLLSLRRLILDTAAQTDGVGALEETLKWGEPAYLTTQSKSGSTIRIHRRKGSDTQYAMYFNCQTTLVDTFRTLFPAQFTYEGTRAIVFDVKDDVPRKELAFCIAMALTYHRAKA